MRHPRRYGKDSRMSSLIATPEACMARIRSNRKAIFAAARFSANPAGRMLETQLRSASVRPILGAQVR